MSTTTYRHAGGSFVAPSDGGRTGVTFRSDDPRVPPAELILDDDDWRQLGAAIARWFPPASAPEPEVRGYVVLIPNRSETYEVGATGVLFSDVRQASAEAAWAEEEFGLTGAQLVTVTALP